MKGLTPINSETLELALFILSFLSWAYLRETFTLKGWDLFDRIHRRSTLRLRFGSRCFPRAGFRHLPAPVEDLPILEIRSVCPTPLRQVNSASERISKARFGF